MLFINDCFCSLTCGLKMMVDLSEFETRQAAAAFSNILIPLSLSASFSIVNCGVSTTSLIMYLPATFSSLPSALLSKWIKFSLEFSATVRKVVIRQLLTAATNRCSGDQMPAIPFVNSGGVAT